MFRICVVLCTLAALLLSGTRTRAGAQSSPGRPMIKGAQVQSAVHHDTSPLVRDIKPHGTKSPNAPARPLRLILPHGANGGYPDTALQTSVLQPALAVATGLNFDG